MEFNNININLLFNKYMNFTNNISDKYNYDNNIRHILYVIIPAFIIKYGIINERKILNVFENTRIITKDIIQEHCMASFNRKIIKTNLNYKIEKTIVLNKNSKILFIDLLDSLIHEFNHAINSINNEIKIEGNNIYLRSGLIYNQYTSEELKKVKESSSLTILEEVLNTIQTEEIIKLILSFKKYKINNNEINNIIYALNNELDFTFKSRAYFLQTYIVRNLSNNITFISTLQKMRFSGAEFQIEKWFDEIVGIKGSLKKMCNKLKEIQELELKLNKTHIFRKFLYNKIKTKANEIQQITEMFSSNCIYK